MALEQCDKLSSKASLKICLLKAELKLSEYKKTVGKNIGNVKRHTAKNKLNYIGFSYEEINAIFHPELIKKRF